MARQMTPDQMLTQLRKWKVQFREFPGWRTRGYGPDSISDAEFIVLHHTGSEAQSDSYLDFLANQGRPDVPPPLCNTSTDMDGDLWLIAAERANHAGRGSSAVLTKVKGGNYDWRNTTLQPGPDDYTGNSYSYGDEIRFDGSHPMTRAAWVTTVLWCASVCDFHNWGAWRVIGHKEHTSRKPDPGSTLMYMIRRDVDAALKAGPGNWPTKQEEPMSAADVQALKDYIDGKFRIFDTAGAEGQRYSALGNAIANVSSDLDNFVRVMQGRYARSEDIHAAEMAAVAPLQVLADHEDVDDALVQQKLQALQDSVASIKQALDATQPVEPTVPKA